MSVDPTCKVQPTNDPWTVNVAWKSTVEMYMRMAYSAQPQQHALANEIRTNTGFPLEASGRWKQIRKMDITIKRGQHLNSWPRSTIGGTNHFNFSLLCNAPVISVHRVSIIREFNSIFHINAILITATSGLSYNDESFRGFLCQYVAQ